MNAKLPPLELHCESGRAHAAYTMDSVEARERILTAEIERLRAECEAVPAGYVPVSALIEAREEIESWAAYADPYFRDKHDLPGVLAKIDALLASQAQQPADAVPADNVTPMRQPRADLARLVESINAAVYANGDGLSVTEAIGALELAKLELLKEQEQ